MSIEMLKDQLPDFAKDVRLNVSTVLSEDGAPGLTKSQIAYVALAASYYTKNADISQAILKDFELELPTATQESAKAAATIMAMNNVYYRFLHLVEDPEYKTLPAKLRMNVIAKPGVEKVDFELACMAVSALAGCGMCMGSHNESLLKLGVKKEAVQSAVRIAAVLNSLAQSLAIAKT